MATCGSLVVGFSVGWYAKVDKTENSVENCAVRSTVILSHMTEVCVVRALSGINI